MSKFTEKELKEKRKYGYKFVYDNNFNPVDSLIFDEDPKTIYDAIDNRDFQKLEKIYKSTSLAFTFNLWYKYKPSEDISIYELIQKVESKVDELINQMIAKFQDGVLSSFDSEKALKPYIIRLMFDGYLSCIHFNTRIAKFSLETFT